MTEEIKVQDAAAADKAKVVVAVLLVVGGITGYYLLSAQPGWVRWLAVVAGLLLAALMVALSAYGRGLKQFVLDARVELRKIVWPTRQETGQVTLAVFIFVIVAGIFFWLIDLGSRGRPGHCPDRGAEMALRWYVVHAYSNFEHRVSESLKERIRRAHLEPKFGEILVPTEEVVEMRDGQKRKSERKFYPGYVLVQMEMDEETWHLVRDVPKVLGFIGGTPEKPAAITDKEANQILRRVEEGVDKPRPKVLFEPGEVVRVIDGPFNDFNGVVESVNYEKNRLQVAVQILGRSTPVELDFSQVEKA